MIDVDYLLTTSSGFLENMADKLSRGYGEKVDIENNGLVFPPGLASGRFEYYGVEPDLSMCVINCTFFEAVRFNRLPLMIHYFHALSFNLSTISFLVEKHNYSGMNIGEGWEKKVMYSTSDRGLGWTAPKGGHVRMVVLYFSRTWLQRYYKIEDIPPEVPYADALMHNLPLQFNLDLDLELLLMLQEVLSGAPPPYMPALYYEGCAKKLIASVASRLVSANEQGTRLHYDEVLQVMDVIRQLEEKLEQATPLLEELAQACFMSKSKFEKLFKAIYGRNLTDFSLGLRMKKAAGLLLEGFPPSAVARQVGYSNLNHFAKVFRNYYKTTPKAYQAGSVRY